MISHVVCLAIVVSVATAQKSVFFSYYSSASGSNVYVVVFRESI